MSTSRISHSRKRRCSQFSRGEFTEPQAKKTKLCDGPTRSPQPPVHYLDTLSKIWLTREALGELNRKTRQFKSNQQRRPGNRRPLTRGYYAELRSRVRSRCTPASQFLQQCAPETLKELKLFAKHGGADLLDLRGYPEPTHPSCYTMSSAQSSQKHKRGRHGSVSTSRTPATSSNTTVTKVTRSSGSAGPNFRQRMMDNCIYPDGYEYPDGRVPSMPKNWDQIQQMLGERRASLSPSRFPEAEYRKFKRADDQVRNEDDARERVISTIQGAGGNTNRVARNTVFNNIANMFPREENLGGEGKKGPVSGRPVKPDYYYGAHPDQLHREVRKELGDHILPSTDDSLPLLPNFFVEAKGPRGSNAVCLNQACIDGAVGARAMHSIKTYGQQVPAYDNKSYTLSATYHAGTLKMYAHHPSQPGGSGTNPEYYMSQLKAYAMTSDHETLVKGVTAFRNGVEWAEAQRNAAIEHANAVVNELDDENEEDEEDDEDERAVATTDPILSSFTSSFSGQMTSRSEATHQDSDTSTDELQLNIQPSKQSTRGKQPRRGERSTRRSSSQHGDKATTYQPGMMWAWSGSA